jgi:hypothetical protein
MSSVKPAVIHVDESGNTGENLKDDAQPVFAFASVRLDDDLASELVSTVAERLRKTGVNELKSRSVLRNAKAQGVLLETLQQVPVDSVFTFVANKQYMVVSKLVDLLVVEAAYNDGYDMYLDGSARALAHYFYYFGSVLGDADAWSELLDTFVDFTAGKDGASPRQFFMTVENFMASEKVTEDPFFGTLRSIRLEGLKWWLRRRHGRNEDDLDPALAAFAAYFNAIGQRVGRFKLVSDESAVIQRHASYLLNVGHYPDLANPGSNFPPTPITEIVFADSVTSPQIQLADWIAATARRHAASLLKGSKAKPLPDELNELVQNWLVWNLWPDSLENLMSEMKR